MVNNQFKSDDIDLFANLSTQIDVCKSLLEIECVSKLKTELDKINEF